MSFIRYFCLLVHSGVQHILCCGFVLVVFVLCLVVSFSGLFIFDCPFGLFISHHNTLKVQTVIDQNAREIDKWSKGWLLAFNPEN